jgi:hypothetical protein
VSFATLFGGVVRGDTEVSSIPSFEGEESLPWFPQRPPA